MSTATEFIRDAADPRSHVAGQTSTFDCLGAKNWFRHFFTL